MIQLGTATLGPEPEEAPSGYGESRDFIGYSNTRNFAGGYGHHARQSKQLQPSQSSAARASRMSKGFASLSTEDVGAAAGGGGTVYAAPAHFRRTVTFAADLEVRIIT